MRRWRAKSNMVSLPNRVASRSQSCTMSSSSSVTVSATISPSGLTITVPAVLDAGFCDRHHKGRILVGAGLQRQLVVEHALGEPLTAFLRIHRGRVEAEHHHLGALQAKHPKRLGPAP